jgi:hypothetical protein
MLGERDRSRNLDFNLIGGTRTRSGLRVKAVLDTNPYETGVEISDKDLVQLRLKRHTVHPGWNYTSPPT